MKFARLSYSTGDVPDAARRGGPTGAGASVFTARRVSPAPSRQAGGLSLKSLAK